MERSSRVLHHGNPKIWFFSQKVQNSKFVNPSLPVLVTPAGVSVGVFSTPGPFFGLAQQRGFCTSYFLFLHIVRELLPFISLQPMPFLPTEANGSSLYINLITFLVMCPTRNTCILRALPCVTKFSWRGQVKSCLRLAHTPSPRLTSVSVSDKWTRVPLTMSSDLRCLARTVVPVSFVSGRSSSVRLVRLHCEVFSRGLSSSHMDLRLYDGRLTDYLGEAVVWTIICWLQHKIAL